MKRSPLWIRYTTLEDHTTNPLGWCEPGCETDSYLRPALSGILVKTASAPQELESESQEVSHARLLLWKMPMYQFSLHRICMTVQPMQPVLG